MAQIFGFSFPHNVVILYAKYWIGNRLELLDEHINTQLLEPLYTISCEAASQHLRSRRSPILQGDSNTSHRRTLYYLPSIHQSSTQFDEYLAFH